MNIERIIKPETELEKIIIANKEFQKGCLWGEPREGHPEGKIIFHIKEVLANVKDYCKHKDKEKLRIISVVHDTFKHGVNQNIPQIGENSHGMLARRFTENYTKDQDILEITELHDEVVRLRSMTETEKLIERLNGRLGLYLLFYKCDTFTGNKFLTDCGPYYYWFTDLARHHL